MHSYLIRGLNKYAFYDEGHKWAKAAMIKHLKNGEVKVKLRERNVRRTRKNPKKMFILSDADRKLTMTEVAFGKDSMTDKLNSPIVFINEGSKTILN